MEAGPLWEVRMDWSDCRDVERRPDILAGSPVIVGTRVPPETILDHVDDGFSLETITTDLFPSVPLARARSVLAFAREHVAHPA